MAVSERSVFGLSEGEGCGEGEGNGAVWDGAGAVGVGVESESPLTTVQIIFPLSLYVSDSALRVDMTD